MLALGLGTKLVFMLPLGLGTKLVLTFGLPLGYFEIFDYIKIDFFNKMEFAKGRRRRSCWSGYRRNPRKKTGPGSCIKIRRRTKRLIF